MKQPHTLPFLKRQLHVTPWQHVFYISVTCDCVIQWSEIRGPWGLPTAAYTCKHSLLKCSPNLLSICLSIYLSIYFTNNNLTTCQRYTFGSNVFGHYSCKVVWQSIRHKCRHFCLPKLGPKPYGGNLKDFDKVGLTAWMLV